MLIKQVNALHIATMSACTYGWHEAAVECQKSLLPY